MVVSRALLGICKDFVGTDDLPEFQRSIRIARSDVGVGAFDGLTECSPETFSIIGWKSPEQIIRRLHRRSRFSTTICAEPLLHDPSAFPSMLLSSGLSFLLPLSNARERSFTF